MLEQELHHTKRDLEASVQRENQLQLQVQSCVSLHAVTTSARNSGMATTKMHRALSCRSRAHTTQLDALKLEVQKMHTTNNSILATQKSEFEHFRKEKQALVQVLEDEANTRYQEVCACNHEHA
jgi:hypothetical protein